MELILSQRKRTPGGHYKGMTTIELVVTIAVIVILAAIILPAIGVVRDNARRTQCVSNLHQIYTTLQLYAADHQGYLPAASRATDPSVPAKQSPNTRWSRDLDEYLPQSRRAAETSLLWENELFVCPAAVTPSGRSGPKYIRMAYNSSAAWYGDGGTNRFEPRHYNSIANPALTPLVYDGRLGPRFEMQTNYYANWPQASSDRNNPPDSMLYFSFRHNGNMNVLTADGAVKSVDPVWLDNLTEQKWKGID
ncbi:type II secretion system protein [Ruficoccus amylovorans]|uniref:Type II secretion system protein n=1 Tax=Ruficoccus amylovorans TaxID=1804625 RepID=A0A842HFZ8_9BACT|nr:type II secretion system protein [Ruficoccus amylovorans]MBC2595199.1 type II secretion system protein [Ruficoccus amylovorans]